MSEAERQLREYQQQLDMDGVMVGVSRQALDEVLAELAALRKWKDKANEMYPVLAEHIGTLLLKQGGK